MSFKRLRKYVRFKVSEIKNFIYVQWRVFWGKKEERKYEWIFCEEDEKFEKEKRMSFKRLRKYVRFKVSEIKYFFYIQWVIFWEKREERKHEKLFGERYKEFKKLFWEGYEKYEKEMKERGEKTDSLTPFDYFNKLTLDEIEENNKREEELKNYEKIKIMRGGRDGNIRKR